MCGESTGHAPVPVASNRCGQRRRPDPVGLAWAKLRENPRLPGGSRSGALARSGGTARSGRTRVRSTRTVKKQVVPVESEPLCYY